MRELPRLTGALRTFGNVSSEETSTQSGDDSWSRDLALRKSLAIEKQKERSTSWTKIQQIIKKNADASKNDITSALQQLIAISKSIVGPEESAETIECGAAFLFSIFKSVDHVGQREATQLRSTFGPYPASAASKCCQLVKRITCWLPESVLAELSTQREEGDGAASIEEFGSSIKFTMTFDDIGEDEEEILSEEEEDLKEVDFHHFMPSHTNIPQGAAAVDNTEFGTVWLVSMLTKYFDGSDTSALFNLDELTSAIFDVLANERSDEEIQNELFDLLGFDRFELIQQLLENRKRLIRAKALETTQTIMQSIPNLVDQLWAAQFITKLLL